MNARIVWLAAVLLSACQSMPPAPAGNATLGGTPGDRAAAYREQAARGAQVYAIDPAASKLRVYVFRGGQAAKNGHNHVLSAPRFEGYLAWPSGDPRQARFELRFPLDALVIDDPALRAETGGSFSGQRSVSDIEGTRRNLLGPKGLDSAQWPFLEVKSLGVEGDWPILVARVEVRLHGVAQEKELMLRVEREPDRLRARGTLVLRQSEFGVVPFSVLGGLLAVQDPVAIEFDLRAVPLD